MGKYVLFWVVYGIISFLVKIAGKIDEKTGKIKKHLLFLQGI